MPSRPGSRDRARFHASPIVVGWPSTARLTTTISMPLSSVVATNVTSAPMPVPLSPPLEDDYRPQSEQIHAAARYAVEWADREEPVPIVERPRG